ncbi:MAG: hypothetical protein AAFR71_07740 [Pseudomonadota bacterium]
MNKDVNSNTNQTRKTGSTRQTTQTRDDPREGFSARILTDPQFEEAIAITGIIKSEIHRSGAFKEKLGDYAHAFARTNAFDASRAESTLRDIFRAEHGMTMNEMREGLRANEDALDKGPELTERALIQTDEIGALVEQGERMSFYRAYEQTAGELAGELEISNAGAKRLMTEAFRDAHGSELYEWGKELDETFYRPQIEAEREARHSQTKQSNVGEGKTRSYGRSDRTGSSRQSASASNGGTRRTLARTGPSR